jgi:short-subunit dehydrogenase
MTPEAFRVRYGPWALVAGASVGLGAAFARQLAAYGLHLVLVDNRARELCQLADELRERTGVMVHSVTLDLGRTDLLDALRPHLRDREVGLLIYNAAAVRIGRFLTFEMEEALRTVDVNCRAPVMLAHELGRRMTARGRGGIVLMSSMAGMQGASMIAAYAASKAFNLALAEGLWAELRQHGVDVMACRPGPTRTPGYEASQPRRQPPLMEPDAVAREALGALGSGPSMVPGRVNRLSSFVLGHLLSRRAAITMLSRLLERMYEP